LLPKTDLDAGSLDQAIDDLEALPFIVAPPATPLLKRAARVGKQFNLTFYDASFLELSVELDCPLITTDGPFFERARSFPRVRHLSKAGNL
jgi:predicted nucleic acid-binding protein